MANLRVIRLPLTQADTGKDYIVVDIRLKFGEIDSMCSSTKTDMQSGVSAADTQELMNHRSALIKKTWRASKRRSSAAKFRLYEVVYCKRKDADSDWSKK